MDCRDQSGSKYMKTRQFRSARAARSTVNVSCDSADYLTDAPSFQILLIRGTLQVTFSSLIVCLNHGDCIMGTVRYNKLPVCNGEEGSDTLSG